MGESPFWRDGAPEGGNPPEPTDQQAPKKGASDPLFNPPGLKTRKTVMGLAPAPHLGGDNRAAVTEAEARKARVLARLAAMDARTPQTEPPDPNPSQSPAEAQGAAGTSIVEQTYIGPPAYGTTTAVMVGPIGGQRTASSDGRIPVPSNVADAEVEPAPNTARMLQATAPASAQARSSQDVAPAPAAALVLRSYDPSGGREQFPHARHALSAPIDKRLVLLNEPHGTGAASFRVLRDNLLAKGMPRVVAVTSAAPNDGKTTCAANLALALTEQPGTRVLLVDGNFFSPDLSKVFTVDRLGSVTPRDAAPWLAPYKIVEVTPTLHVAGVPASAAQAASRFEHHRFDALIERLVRVSYDYVVIDTPAMRGTPAVMQLLSTADGALLVVRSGGTTTRDLRRAAEQLPPKKALGIALMDVFL